MTSLGARIEPMRALLYDPDRVGDVSRVVAPPYDIISSVEQQALYDRSPYNIVRVELSREADRYAAAQATLREWLDNGVLRRASIPAIYQYTQQFMVKSRSYSRTGFIARFRLEEFASGRVLPHEKTFPAAKEDRLKLLTATRTNISSIFGLYAGSHPELDGLRAQVAARDPLIHVHDDLGIRNQLRIIDAPAEIAIVQQALESTRVLIADGHHRYETALNYRRQRRSTESATALQGFDYTMMTLVACDDPGLVILPTHRIVRRLRPAALESFASEARKTFELTELEGSEKLQSALAASDRGAFGIALRGTPRLFLLKLRDWASVANALPDIPEPVRALDVTVLHTLIFDHVFSLTSAEIRKGGSVEYTIDADAALDEVQQGRADGAFLMIPPSINDVERVSDAGATMPEKSTYFYPKLLTGLVLNPLDD